MCITIDGGEANLRKRPGLARHIAKLAALRKKCADRIANGRFRHTEGLSCENSDGVNAYCYDSNHGPAVVIAAGENGGTAQVKINKAQFNLPDNRATKLIDLDLNESVIPVATELELTLRSNQVIVWYI